LSFLTNTQRGSTRIEVGEEGEGTPATTAAEILVTAGEEASDITLDIRMERARLGRERGKWWIWTVRDKLNKGVKLGGR
jgi:hypothetical protein